MKFKKARPGVLRLNVGGGTKLVKDDEILEGAYWKKFADLGMLVLVEEEAAAPVPKPVTKKAPAKEPEKVPEEPKKAEPKAEPEPEPKAPEPESKVEEGTMTKSFADKMAKAQGDKGTSVSTKSKTKRRKK
jgi:hypothetical protein